MRRLKIILQCRYLFKILAIIILLGDILYTNLNNITSKYSKDQNKFIGVVTKYELQENKLVLEVKSKEKLIVNYKYGDNIFNNLSYGDKILIKGSLKEPSVINIPNTFNYKNYLYNKRIHYIVEANSIDKLENNKNYLYTIKNELYKRINNLKSSNYIKTLLLGDNNLDKQINNSYRTNGISHLFSISGMHINFITSIIYFYLNRITHNRIIKHIIIDIFLIFYLILVGTSSLMRSTIMNLLFSINFILKINIKKTDILLITLIVSIIINPFIIYDIGFIYSYVISYFLTIYSFKLKSKSKIKNIISVTLLSFFISLPITIYSSYEINIISIFMNIILVPVVSIILFPLTILTLIFPILDNILYIITRMLENLSLYVSNIEITKIIFPKPNILFILVYYFLTIIIIKKKQYSYMLILLLIFHYLSPNLNYNMEITMFDVGQADSMLITYPHNKANILVDTGKTDYTMKNGIIPYLKSKGIRRIDYLIITHGDEDHIGGAKTLINNFKVDNIILNRGEYTELEIELINSSDKINIINNVNKIKIDNRYIYFLNNKIYNSENDNSIVLYFQHLKYKFLFMGDSSFVVEDYLLETYKLRDISILKVGHHGSSTSTTKEFVRTITPKISLISVGKNNYGHPSKEVLENLQSSIIYRTDKIGSINIKIYKKKVKIKKYKKE